MGIGTLAERSLHATLKRYCEPDESLHEVSYGRYVADVMRGEEILEIQTRQFYRMLPKLQYFLKDKQVTVVYPISHIKYLIWIDPETGEEGKKRKSPKIGVVQELFYELYGLNPILHHPNLRFRVILTDVEEYRLLDGWSKNRKRGSHRAERIPIRIVQDVIFDSKDTWKQMIPPELEQPFTVKEYAAVCHISELCASRGCSCLCRIGVLERCGKKRNAYLYQVVSD